jgi:hypothetical protein
MTRLTILCATALVCAPAHSRTLDQRLHDLPASEWVFQGLNIADAVTTIDALNHGCIERNPMLGHHPSHGAVIGQTVAVGILHAAGTSFLQDHAPRAVPLWEILTIGVKGGAVVSNLTVRF